MSKVRVIKREDGGVSIIHPVRPLKENETWDEYFSKSTPEGAVYEDMDKTELPTDRADRNAWELGDDKKIKVNAVKKAELDAVKADKEADDQALKDLVKDKKDGKI